MPSRGTKGPSATDLGFGTAVPLTSDAGYFWFFDSSNVELIVKVVDACVDPFNRFWIFGAGLTNVEVTLRITDLKSGLVKSHVNPLGTAYAPIQDTDTFATCP